MSLEIKTVGYKFRVVKDALLFDIVSLTELGIEESNKIIRDFFENFKITGNRRVDSVDVPTDSRNVGSISDKAGDSASDDRKIKPARGKRSLMKNIWGNVRDLLDEEFTIGEYGKALRKAGYEYTKGSWEAVPGQQIRKLVKLGKIEKIEDTKPVKYRKIKFPTSIKSDKDTDKIIESLKNGEKAIIGTIR